MIARNQPGFSLIELTLVIALVGGLMVTLGLSASIVVARASDTDTDSRSRATTHAALDEIREAIRLAENVHKAGDDLLVVSTRYYFDSDPDLEMIRFQLTGDALLRDISHNGGATFSTPEVVLRGVHSFTAESLRIADSFDPADYDDGLDALDEGDPDAVDTKSRAEYLVRDLGKVDPDLVDAYLSGKLEVTGNDALGTWLTVSSPVDHTELRGKVLFTPRDSASAYSPLHFGDIDTGTGVLFDPFGKISAYSSHLGAPLAIAVAGEGWAAGETYVIQVEFFDEVAWIAVETIDGTELISTKIATSSALSVDSFKFVNGTVGATGAWDDLEIGYGLVTATLTVDGDDGLETLEARVAPRAW